MSIEKRAAALTKEKVAALLVANESLLEKFNREAEKVRERDSRIAELEQELKWFRRQIFGQKSEKRILGSLANRQLYLGQMLEVPAKPPPVTETVKTYERRQRRKFPDLGDDESNLRFDASVPVEEIEVPNPELEGLTVDQYEAISEKITYRLAQKAGPYVVLKYVRKVVKLKDSGELSCPPAPPTVMERSFADVSFLAGLVLDKFRYHLPLYRQHQRLEACGVHISRGTLINLVIRVSQLLEPIYLALFSSILESRVLAMDETPIKVGRKEPGKMKTGYFWPIYGDKDEIVFLFSPSRATAVVSEALKDFAGILLTDGFKVYERFAEKVSTVIHAQCWVHARRYFDKAKDNEPVLSNQALDIIGALYKVEELCRNRKPEEKLAFRRLNAKPLVDRLFSWLASLFTTQVLLPTNPFTAAANYALKREKELRVFLDYPDLQLDTNHLERTLRPIPLGRKNWLFCWTELGARAVGILQSLIASCRLQNIDPYTYLVDVLQRIDSHPAQDVRNRSF
jgi:transposase